MPTVISENQKPLRKALDIMCGIDQVKDIPLNDTINADLIGANNAKITEVGIRPILMDLSCGGFVNDGAAEPLQSEPLATYSKYGYITKLFSDDHGDIYDADGVQRSIRITVSPSEPTNYSVIAQDATSEEMNRNVQSTEAVEFTKWTPNKRVMIDRIVAGRALQFNRSTLVSCNLELRGVETKVNNPTLQMSEIEIQAYEPNDYTRIIGSFTENAPIWYTAGYQGDMSPIRQFYLSDTIQYDNKVLTIHGQDSTKFLDNEYAGKLLTSDALNGYVEAIHTMLNNEGIAHEYDNRWNDGLHGTNTNMFIWNKPKRDVIAEAVNMFSFEHTGTAEGSETVPIRLRYVDAGRPRLYTPMEINRRNVYEIPGTYKLDATIESNLAIAEAYIYAVSVGTARVSLGEQSIAGTAIFETSEPYTGLITSKGTVTQISPFKYSLTATGSATVSGYPVSFYDTSIGAIYSPYTVANSEEGSKLSLGELDGFNIGLVTESGTDLLGEELVANLLNRSNLLYTFTWRGDPFLQPGDYIRVNGMDMTIESVSLTHEGGGLSSKITAREGLI